MGVFAAAADPDVWRWQPHPEVWVLVIALVGLYAYAALVIGPKVVPAGERALRPRQVLAFAAGVAVLAVASDWPMHDIGEEYLYSVHMTQHLLLTLVMPPLFLLATPRWLADLVLGDGRVRRATRWCARPVVAGVAFNAAVIAVHWPSLVNASVASGPLHYAVHFGVVFAAVMMWTPVCGPIEEWRMTLPAQMIYLFLMSVVPTVPGAWLTFADNAVYDAYDIPVRVWGLTVQDDQQAAGLIMKLAGGSYLWAIITSLFFVWAGRHERAQQAGRRVAERDVLTWQQVEAEFAASQPAPEPASKPPA